jgi:hypothetical protein
MNSVVQPCTVLGSSFFSHLILIVYSFCMLIQSINKKGSGCRRKKK